MSRTHVRLFIKFVLSSGPESSVALSRVKSLAGLLLTENISFSRVQKLGGRGLEERKNGYIRIYGSNNDSNMLPLTLREQLPQQRIHISRTPI